MNTLKAIAIVSFVLWSWGWADQLCAYPSDQLYSSYWHPDELLSWSPATDRDAPYNRSFVPLANRFADHVTQVNVHARPDEGRVVALSIMYPSTSDNPSQGSDQFDIYAFNYWQYVDLLVMWGGSAGEGLVLSPSADVIDAAHRNGVPVYGTIFLPPIVYGGQLEWVWDLVQKEGETFPVADKLIEVAEYYGFDGWFINQETAGGNAALASQMRDFMKYIKETSEVRIMWYDAMTESGSIAWQNALTTSNDMFLEDEGRVSDEMFLNFWWSPYGLITSGILAGQLDRDRYDLYAGIDVQANGYNTYANWEAIFPEDTSHTVSLGFYCPNWCFSNSSGHEDFYEKANRFWVGENGDPGNTATSSYWKGIAHYVPAKSSIDDVPFATSFNTGQGYLYAIDGQFSRIGAWNNRSLQSILPTWRWIIESSGIPLQVELDWSDAYHGGTCLKVHGDLSTGNPTHLKLFKTQLSLTGGETLAIVYKTGSADTPSNMKVGLAFQDDPGAFQFLEVGSSITAGWNTKILDLDDYSGKTVAVISLKFESIASRSDYTVRIGQMALSQGAAQIPSPPSGAYLEHFDLVDAYRGTARLRWTHSPDPVYAYYIYRVNPDSSRTFLGGTPNNAYFVSRLDRVAQEERAVIEVQAVGLDFARSQVETTSVSWEETRVGPGQISTRPEIFGLSQNYPNPFNAETEVTYQIPEDNHVTLKIYAVTGQEVRTLADGRQPADRHVLSWDGRDNKGGQVASGIYLCRLEAGDYRRTIKMVLVR